MSSAVRNFRLYLRYHICYEMDKPQVASPRPIPTKSEIFPMVFVGPLLPHRRRKYPERMHYFDAAIRGFDGCKSLTAHLRCQIYQFFLSTLKRKSSRVKLVVWEKDDRSHRRKQECYFFLKEPGGNGLAGVGGGTVGGMGIAPM